MGFAYYRGELQVVHSSSRVLRTTVIDGTDSIEVEEETRSCGILEPVCSLHEKDNKGPELC